MNIKCSIFLCNYYYPTNAACLSAIKV